MPLPATSRCKCSQPLRSPWGISREFQKWPEAIQRQVHSQGSANGWSQEQKRNINQNHVPMCTVHFFINNQARFSKQHRREKKHLSFCPQSQIEPRLCRPRRASDFLLLCNDESFPPFPRFSLSPFITSGLGFKGKGSHLQVKSPPNGIRCDTGGAARENTLGSRVNLRLCVP